jgi:hypothetical protein
MNTISVYSGDASGSAGAMNTTNPAYNQCPAVTMEPTISNDVSMLAGSVSSSLSISYPAVEAAPTAQAMAPVAVSQAETTVAPAAASPIWGYDDFSAAAPSMWDDADTFLFDL